MRRGGERRAHLRIEGKNNNNNYRLVIMNVYVPPMASRCYDDGGGGHDGLVREHALVVDECDRCINMPVVHRGADANGPSGLEEAARPEEQGDRHGMAMRVAHSRAEDIQRLGNHAGLDNRNGMGYTIDFIMGGSCRCRHAMRTAIQGRPTPTTFDDDADSQMYAFASAATEMERVEGDSMGRRYIARTQCGHLVCGRRRRRYGTGAGGGCWRHGELRRAYCSACLSLAFS